MRWIKTSEQHPTYNVGVLVFIPEEDNHITTGMWDISKKWVLLDEYRVPKSEVTYWCEMPSRPKDTAYTPTKDIHDEETTTEIIRKLQKRIYELEHSHTVG